VKFLIDDPISFRVAILLREKGYEAVHVSELGMAAAPDEILVERAIDRDEVIVSADNDFGKILATLNLKKPSFILFRWQGLRKADQQAEILTKNLPTLHEHLEKGVIATITPQGIRIRNLPLR